MKRSIEAVIAMGSKSDLPVMMRAATMLESLGVGARVEIVSAHRTPALLEKSVRDWESRGVRVIIAGAGGAAHLPGMLASYSTLPVIGVPVKSKSMDGLDALLSIAQMPQGVPVACVAVDNAANAALLAAQILASGESSAAMTLRRKLLAHKKRLSARVRSDRARLLRLGMRRFLK